MMYYIIAKCMCVRVRVRVFHIRYWLTGKVNM